MQGGGRRLLCWLKRAVLSLLKSLNIAQLRPSTQRHPVLYEYYNTGDDDANFVYGATWRYQTFTPTVAHKITSVNLLLGRQLSPGAVTVSIRATDVDGKPTGADLISGTTDGNTLPAITSPYEWREIGFGAAGYALIAGTKYAIVWRALTGGPDDTVYARLDGSVPTYAGGNYGYSIDSGATWVENTSVDFLFEERGYILA